jgi:hypothetical protein
MAPYAEAQANIPCSTASLEAGEVLFGTAPRVDTYFLLEYSGMWEAKALEQSSLPEAVKAYLGSLLKKFPFTRLLLVKSTTSHQGSGISFWVDSVRESNPVLYEFHLQAYQDLLELDVPAVLDGSLQYQANRRQSPLFLVCANGRRDACCARLGTPVFLELQKQAGAYAWESTHMGGHRFAANLLYLPYGILYGRVEPSDVSSIMEATRHNRVALEHYRGRSCYDEAVQAADYYLRQVTGALELDAFRLQAVQETATNEWLVRFLSTESGQEHRMRVAVEKTGVQISQNCRPDKLTPVIRYRLLEQPAK